MKIQFSSEIDQSESIVVLSSSQEATKPLKMAEFESIPKNSHARVFSGMAGELVVYRRHGTFENPHVLFIGFSKNGVARHEQLRTAASKVVSALKREKIKSATVVLSEETTGDFQFLAEGIALGAYELTKFKTVTNESDHSIDCITLRSKNPSYTSDFKRGLILAESVNFARTLGDLPPSHLSPSEFCRMVKGAVGNLSLGIEEWDKQKLSTEHMNGLLTVGRGSAEDSRMLILRYNGGNKGTKPICLVGKGITFDSGGLDIKSTKNMEEMRYDMSGAAVVSATVMAISKLQLPVNIVAFAALAENMPGPGAVKPGDIYKARNGKTIEVMNTDAEGRLVLADAICLANEENPIAIVDVATLTGAIIAALGNIHTGFFTNSDQMRESLKKASEQTGEKIWELPLSQEHEEDMKGQFADLSNQASKPGAASATAAAFLSQFILKDTPWAHLDIAGTAQNIGDRVSYSPKKGASGVMIRTLVRFAELFAS